MILMKLKEFGVDLADKIASFVGSWEFIIIQSVVLIGWMLINLDHMVAFDPYPFILMNLFLSAQAAYATPMILMSSNRQAIKDREELVKDLKVDENTNELLKDLHKIICKIEQDLELDRQALKDHSIILDELKKIKKNGNKSTSSK